jgi:hypothetical protein
MCCNIALGWTVSDVSRSTPGKWGISLEIYSFKERDMWRRNYVRYSPE